MIKMVKNMAEDGIYPLFDIVKKIRNMLYNYQYLGEKMQFMRFSGKIIGEYVNIKDNY